MNHSANIRVAAFTGGLNDPSARFRVRQMIPALHAESIHIADFSAPFNRYPPSRKSLRPFWFMASLVSRTPQIVRSRYYDLVLFQRELISTLSTLERFTAKPRIFDVDDAIHLNRGGYAAKRIAELCDLVICGNLSLAEQYSSWTKRVAILPTPVDCAHFSPLPRIYCETPVIGWIGSSSNFRYLMMIEDALLAIVRKHPAVRIRIVADREPPFTTLSSEHVEFVKWSETLELNALRSFDIGLMPLADGEWERGKCSFKMLQYMACGIPYVVSPVGMNKEVLKKGEAGFSADSAADWIEALDALLSDLTRARQMGAAGRVIVERNYSTTVIVPQLARLIRSAL